MTTELKKVFVYVRDCDGKTSVEVSSSQFDSTYCSDITRTVSAPLCEMEVEVPAISSEEAQKVLSGALLESLIEEREKVRAETHRRLTQLDQRIADLQCLEFKGPEVQEHDFDKLFVGWKQEVLYQERTAQEIIQQAEDSGIFIPEEFRQKLTDLNGDNNE